MNIKTEDDDNMMVIFKLYYKRFDFEGLTSHCYKQELYSYTSMFEKEVQKDQI